MRVKVIEYASNRGAELVNRPDKPVSQAFLQLSPAFFDRIHIGRSGREMGHLDRRVIDELGDFVRRKISRVI